MKRTGPPRKPTKLKLLHGTFRADRVAPNEPMPELQIPDVPAHLNDEAKVEWGRISQELAALGILTRLDRAMLAAYCQAWGRWVKAEKKIAEIDAAILAQLKLPPDASAPKTQAPQVNLTAGEIVQAPSGYLMRSAWLDVANKAMDQVHKFGVEMGLSAPARTRIDAKPPKTPQSSWSQFGTK